MNKHLDSARKYLPSAAAALLFTALLAQAPHAATVFIRIAPSDVHWEAWGLAILGGVVYAIALESATAYFVWRNKMRWAIAFALFSIMHNVAYYMPGAWTFAIASAEDCTGPQCCACEPAGAAEPAPLPHLYLPAVMQRLPSMSAEFTPAQPVATPEPDVELSLGDAEENN